MSRQSISSWNSSTVTIVARRSKSSHPPSIHATKLSPSIIIGPAARSGRFIKAIGDVVLKRVAQVVIWRRLRTIKARIIYWERLPEFPEFERDICCKGWFDPVANEKEEDFLDLVGDLQELLRVDYGSRINMSVFSLSVRALRCISDCPYIISRGSLLPVVAGLAMAASNYSVTFEATAKEDSSAYIDWEFPCGIPPWRVHEDLPCDKSKSLPKLWNTLIPIAQRRLLQVYHSGPLVALEQQLLQSVGKLLMWSRLCKFSRYGILCPYDADMQRECVAILTDISILSRPEYDICSSRIAYWTESLPERILPRLEPLHEDSVVVLIAQIMINVYNSHQWDGVDQHFRFTLAHRLVQLCLEHVGTNMLNEQQLIDMRILPIIWSAWSSDSEPNRRLAIQTVAEKLIWKSPRLIAAFMCSTDLGDRPLEMLSSWGAYSPLKRLADSAFKPNEVNLAGLCRRLAIFTVIGSTQKMYRQYVLGPFGLPVLLEELNVSINIPQPLGITVFTGHLLDTNPVLGTLYVMSNESWVISELLHPHLFNFLASLLASSSKLKSAVMLVVARLIDAGGPEVNDLFCKTCTVVGLDPRNYAEDAPGHRLDASTDEHMG